MRAALIATKARRAAQDRRFSAGTSQERKPPMEGGAYEGAQYLLCERQGCRVATHAQLVA